MNVLKFTGKDMRSALASARDTLGPEALILDTTETATGLEITAALDFESASFPQSAQRRQQADEASRLAALTAETFSLESVAADAVPTKPGSPADLDQMREEVESIRCLMESHLARSGWSQVALGSPAKASVMRNLSSLGLAPDIVRMLVDRLGRAEALSNTWVTPLRALTEAIPFTADDPMLTGRALALVGPTGSGKTTTLGKLAAKFVQEHPATDLALVSLDSLRVGASQQIEVLGQLIGAPVYRAPGDRGLRDVMPLVEDKKLVLIDTPGLGQHDPRLGAQLGRLEAEGLQVDKLLTLPANVEHDALQEIVDAFRPAGLAGCVITKIDESACLGAALSVVIRSSLAVAYLANGQNMPDDLYLASARASWLVKQAVDTMRSRRHRASERYMAENFFGVHAREST
ncbi:MAG: flagellar biosynthesis protein FlhF [Gammaproteobacteria bacterium]|jgi:flagellar biosynthesis protein FlhF